MLFKAEYHIFTHNRAGIEQIGSDNYSLPAHLFDHVELVTPTVSSLCKLHPDQD